MRRSLFWTEPHFTGLILLLGVLFQVGAKCP
jgi:hypothetical protein